jgi:hypothetical protein
MPAKKTILTEEERAARLREIAKERETSDDPKDFESAFKKVTEPPKVSRPDEA